MKLIATHNSATGEKSRHWLFSLLTPFTRCQDLTISEQYAAGCNYFDLRVRWINNQWTLCHGLWQSKYSLTDMLDELIYLSFESVKPVVSIFYEGRFPSDFIKQLFLDDMQSYAKEYPYIRFAVFGVKKPEWTELIVNEDIPLVSKFIGISRQNHTSWLPIPRFWNQFAPPADFNEYEYTMVDFLTL